MANTFGHSCNVMARGCALGHLYQCKFIDLYVDGCLQVQLLNILPPKTYTTEDALELHCHFVSNMCSQTSSKMRCQTPDDAAAANLGAFSLSPAKICCTVALTSPPAQKACMQAHKLQ